ncbi:MAG: SMP-30/gluconolactonase/LRE family protein [Acidimicrobiaceae bacterium]|nr:SMP-30/gluconolactonase/LRE family protein [Acidimicrobiaceae bacterium]
MDRIRTEFETLDPGFAGIGGDEWVECLWSGGRWTEGPAYFAAGRYLVFSDIPNDRVLRWDETTGSVGVLRQPAGHANGHIVDRQGRLISCEQGRRQLTRTEHDGSVTVLADRLAQGRLNSPNDVVEHSGGSIWFTDPSYGIDSDYEGVAAPSELDGCHVYRVDPSSRRIDVVADDFERPNGLAFSADERTLYIADTRRKHIRRFHVDAAHELSGGRSPPATGSGWTSRRSGLDGFTLSPAVPAGNSTFQGRDLRCGNHMFITASSSVYALRVNFAGCHYPGSS